MKFVRVMVVQPCLHNFCSI